jgi:hypothetical protein
MKEDEEEQSRSGGVLQLNFMNSSINTIRKLGIWKGNETEITCGMGLKTDRMI